MRRLLAAVVLAAAFTVGVTGCHGGATPKCGDAYHGQITRC